MSLSASTVKRRRKALGLKGSGSTRKEIDFERAEQLVLDQMAEDPAKHHGVRTIQNKIAQAEMIHLPRWVNDSTLLHPLTKFNRDMVSDIMHAHDDKGFQTRDPTAKKVSRTPKVPIGIHERWAADGHDKLYKIGFPIWAIVDDATGKWLGAWVVPSNRMNVIIGYLFLCCVEKHGGKFLHYRIPASP